MKSSRIMTTLFSVALILGGIVGIYVSVVRGQEWAKLDQDMGTIVTVGGIAGTIFVVLLLAMLIEASLNLAKLNDNVTECFTKTLEKIDKENKRLYEIRDDVASTFIKCRYIKDDISSIATLLGKTYEPKAEPTPTISENENKTLLTQDVLCAFCGQPLHAGAKFCNNCGEKSKY